MSANSTPITARHFAEAIKELILPNLHLKAAEIRNSIAHLMSSNEQLQPLADEGDSECREAIDENVVVIRRMEERICLLKQEVEGRGFKWGEEDQEYADMNEGPTLKDEQTSASPGIHSTSDAEGAFDLSGGHLGDDELAQRISERIGDDVDENNVGRSLRSSTASAALGLDE
ncbi:hypothetical protein ACLMJK_004159 [Lecanora helva]